jgi:hypothetical protein
VSVKPTGSIKLRVETIGYFLKRYRDDMIRNKNKAGRIEEQLREFEAKLRLQMLRERLENMADAFRNRRHAADPRERRRAGGVERRARVRAGVGRLSGSGARPSNRSRPMSPHPLPGTTIAGK